MELIKEKCFRIKRIVLEGKQIFNSKIILNWNSLKCCRVKKEGKIYYIEIPYYKGIYAKILFKISDKTIKESENKEFQFKNRNIEIQYDCTTDSLKFLNIKYDVVVNKLFDLPEKDNKDYKVHFNLTKTDLTVDTTWFIPKSVVQYITPNEAQEKKYKRPIYGLMGISSGGGCSPR